jgi:hypothetical protein
MAQSTQAAYRKPLASGAPAILPAQEGLYANSSVAQFTLGQKVTDIEGNTYRYVKAAEALARGQVVTATALAAWDTTIVIDGAVTAGDTLMHVDTNTSVLTEDQYKGYWIGQAPAAGPLGALHKIHSHPAIAASSEMDVQLDPSTPAAEAIGDGVALLLFHPWLMELCDATTETIRGVVVNTIDSGYFGFIQTGGFVPSVLTGHSTSAAVVLNEPLTPLATPAGSVQGFAGNTEADVLEASASRLIALEAVAADTVCHLPAYFIGEV